jgi:hypothetical protein
MPETKKYYHNLDVDNNKVVNPLLNPLTTAQRLAVGATLTALDEGYVCFDTTSNQQYFWDGTTWITTGGGGTWGSITGLITNQTDLIAYLSGNYYPLSSNPAGYITSAALSGYVPNTRNLTINGTTYDLSADRTWTIPVGTGTVTSVQLSAGTGISLSGTNPITTSGTITVTNSAPDQTVVLNSGTGISVTGTYPNFTITATGGGGGGTVTGTGTATQVAFWNTASSISSDADLYWDNTNKYLGIGINTPLYPLHVDGAGYVNGDLTISSPNYLNLSFVKIGGSTNAFGLDYASIEATSLNTGIALVASPSGNPPGFGYAFQFKANQNINQLLFVGDNTTQAHYIHTDASPSANGWPLIFGVAPAGQNWSTNSTLLVLTANQRVGIGNLNPQTTLHVGNAGGAMAFPFEEAVVEKNTDTKFGIYTSVNIFGGGGASYVLGATNLTTALGYYPGFEFQFSPQFNDADNFIRYNFLQRDATGAVVSFNDNIFNIYADSRASFKTLVGTGTEMVVADSSGFISRQAIPSGTITGTGTATRVAFWDTSSSISSDADLYWDNTNKRLGVGTTTPSKKLTVKGNMWMDYSTDTQCDGFSLGQTFDNLITLRATATGSPGGSDFALDMNYGSIPYTPFFIKRDSRYIGINTTNPLYQLDVNGNQSITGYLNFKPTGSAFSTSQIKIGSNDIANGGTSLSPRLILIGNTVATSLSAATTNDSLLAIGYAAANTITTGGIYSIHIGRNSGGGITTGGFNTHISSGDTFGIPSNTEGTIHLIAGGGYEINNAARVLSGLTTKYAFIGGGYDNSRYINDFYLGAGPFVIEPQQAGLNLFAPSATTDVTSGGTWAGVDAPGSNFTINAGRGTGTGNPGDFIVKTATKTTTGNTQQTLAERLKVAGDTGDVTASSLAGTGTRMVTADSTGKLSTQTVPSMTGGVLHGTAAGTDTYTTTITGPTAYNDGDAYLIRFTTGNTGTSTLNINSLGAIPLYRNNDGPLLGGDIVDGAEMLCVYNSGTNRFQTIGVAPNTLLAYVTNDDSVTITKGQPVYAFSGTGDRMTVKLAYNTGDSTSAQTVGLVMSTSIAAGQKGLIMMQGLLDGLSILPTSTYNDGDPIYLGATPGSITKVKPYAPNHLVYLGVVTTASPGAAGRMYVRVQNGYELDELHNVQAQSPVDKATLYYDLAATQWKTATIPTVLGYTPLTRVISSVSTATAAGSAAATDYVYLVSGTTTVTLPTAVGNSNQYTIKRVGTNTVTIGTTSSQTMDGSTSITLNVQYQSLTFISDGANWNII